MESRIRDLVLPIAHELGVEVLKVRLGGGGRTRLVQIIVDRRGGVDSDTLERISRGVSLQLDAEDLIAGAYRLEVSSPGFDWQLVTPEDYARYEGDWLKVDMADGHSVEGYNRGWDADAILLEGADGQALSVPRLEAVRVVRAINWKDVARRKR
jgi:ribosome maturation factor RimP